MNSDECLPALRALADPTRQKLVELILTKPRTVNELSEGAEIPQYNVSKHLKVLREAGIIVAEKRGKEVHCEVAEAFRTKLKQGGWALDLGCCSFRFDEAKS